MKLDELAKLAGVSRTTASYVVNGKAKQYRVSDKTIAKVKALIKEYDFKPDALAASLRVGKSHTIGLIIPDFENISYAKIANQLENRCREKGYQLLISCSNDNEQNEMACVKQLLNRKVDALIVSSALTEPSDFYQTQAKHLPIIGFDRKAYGDNVLNVLANDEQDAFRLADNLLLQSEQKILFLGALPELSLSRERETGFRRALKVRSKSAEFLYAEQFHKQQGAEVFAQWLNQNSLPDAIFVTSFTLLRGVFQVLLERYKSIPKNLVIATFGHHEMLDLLENKVICSVQNHSSVVNALLEMVFNRLEYKGKHDGIEQKPLERELLSRNC
ncbi:DNA-binding transcriptional regulator FruR [Pasteurellaceae bacterium Pebbles2]|nr:DNA-binding transcriptional regulator FruR [Pasteurellaceae bacterium Pebbles2]